VISDSIAAQEIIRPPLLEGVVCLTIGHIEKFLQEKDERFP